MFSGGTLRFTFNKLFMWIFSAGVKSGTNSAFYLFPHVTSFIALFKGVENVALVPLLA